MTWDSGWRAPAPRFPVEQSFPIQLPAGAPSAPVPVAPRPRGALLGAAAASLILAVVLGGISWSQYASSHSASSVVKRYFAALTHDDAASALAFAAVPPSADSGRYLTSEVLAVQSKTARLSGVSVIRTGSGTSQTTVDVRYTLNFADGPQTVQDSVGLIKRGSSWRLSRVASTVEVSARSAGGDRITFAGRPVPSSSVTLFPGALPVATDSPAVVVSGHPSVRLASDDSISLRPELSGAARTKVADALEAALTRCLAPTSTDPLCPMVAGGRPVPGTLHGRLTERIADSTPSVGLSSAGNGLVTVTADAQIEASWKVWDFNNQQVSRSQATTVTVNAQGSVEDLSRLYWVAPNG
ncbi:MAG: hypothetical protein QOK10_1273 [Pseudonocardiales bacterium]|jgi:hypothetical protein|nr:hypothetical protein [Pseudonocardiales bacterium]